MSPAEVLIPIVGLGIPILFWCAVGYFFIKLAVKHAILEAHEQLEKQKKEAERA